MKIIVSIQCRVMKGPVGKTTAQDETKKADLHQKIHGKLPHEKVKEMLKGK